jgi:hypothetical protein
LDKPHILALDAETGFLLFKEQDPLKFIKGIAAVQCERKTFRLISLYPYWFSLHSSFKYFFTSANFQDGCGSSGGRLLAPKSGFSQKLRGLISFFRLNYREDILMYKMVLSIKSCHDV